MEEKYGYIYIRNHPSYDIEKACKLGKTYNVPERDSQYATGEIRRGYFYPVFQVPYNLTSTIEESLQYLFSDINIKYDGGTEFYNKEIIDRIEPYLIEECIKYKKLTEEEISELTRCNREKQNKSIWNERDYQREIINFSKKELLQNKKIYIELPTGGGKSYIVYNLFEILRSKIIIIISPRKIVNLQNILPKYLQILKNNYDILNYSTNNKIDEFLQSTNNEYKIIICCTQSLNKIYDNIISNNIKDITIWFDEAHWGVEDWINDINKDKKIKFWLENTEQIKYRIYTSASPNKSLILQNEVIFGKLCSNITVSELIKHRWLANLTVHVYNDNISNVNNVKYMLDDFKSKKCKYGFSFHNKQKNAFKLFYKHYLEYKNKKTNIKPFLLVSDNFTVDREPMLNNIDLEFNYRDISTFETNIHSIGYVVAKYNMGYDFHLLDYMCISDPKLSYADIIQSIGRGIRPDKLGVNGSNKDKVLLVSLPVYIDIDGENKYQKIIEVLKYLINDIEIEFENIQFTNREISADKESKAKEYNGINIVKSAILNLIDLSYDKVKKLVVEKNIKCKEDYYKLCDKDIRLPREPDIKFPKHFKGWINFLDIHKNYYDFDTCKNKIIEYLSQYPELKRYYLDLVLLSKELCKIDKFFPPSDLWNEYYNVKSLDYIVVISNNKKIIGALL
jgi:superfamily II DNA or RNA helicase